MWAHEACHVPKLGELLDILPNRSCFVWAHEACHGLGELGEELFPEFVDELIASVDGIGTSLHLITTLPQHSNIG